MSDQELNVITISFDNTDPSEYVKVTPVVNEVKPLVITPDIVSDALS